MSRTCVYCSAPLKECATGSPPRKYCDRACEKKAIRVRKVQREHPAPPKRVLTPFQSLTEQLRRARREARAFDDVWPAAVKEALKLAGHQGYLRVALAGTKNAWRRSYELHPATAGDEAAEQLGRIILDDSLEHHELEVRQAA